MPVNKNNLKTSQVIFKNNFPKASSLAENPVLIFDKYLLKIPSVKKWILTFPLRVAVTAGEDLKQFNSFEKIFIEILSLVEKTGTKNLTLVALGGGSVGDFVGFLASVFKRGIPLIHIPSTWLSAIDSSHGGKTALNVGGYKNQIGTFYSASEIYLIKPLLFSQPEERVHEALGEVLKTILLDGKQLWETTKSWKFFSPLQLWKILPTLIQYKYKIVALDPFEKKGIRFVLNFGHTFGHALESKLKLAHGTSVNYGLRIALEFSLEMNVLNPKEYEKIISSPLIKNFLYDKKQTFHMLKKVDQSGKLKKYLLQDKKSSTKNKVNFVFLSKVGTPKVISVDTETVLLFAQKKIKELET